MIWILARLNSIRKLIRNLALYMTMVSRTESENYAKLRALSSLYDFLALIESKLYFLGGAKFPKGGQISYEIWPGGGGIFPRKFGPGGQIFRGAKFPVTPESSKILRLCRGVFASCLCLRKYTSNIQ